MTYFGVHSIRTVGPSIEMTGRCYSGKIVVGKMFNLLRVVNEDRKTLSWTVVNWVIDQIEIYGRNLDCIESGLTAKLLLHGKPIELEDCRYEAVGVGQASSPVHGVMEMKRVFMLQDGAVVVGTCYGKDVSSSARRGIVIFGGQSELEIDLLGFRMPGSKKLESIIVPIEQFSTISEILGSSDAYLVY